MECKKCRSEYNSTDSIPLTCQCGGTLCKNCVNSLSISNTFQCPTCKAQTSIDKLWPNRGIEEVSIELKVLQESLAINKPKIVKIYSGSLPPHTISSESTYIQIDDKQISAKIDCNDRNCQTTSNFILMQKISEKKLCVNIAWGKCFIVLLYFILCMPWVMIANLSTEGYTGYCSTQVL